MRINPPPPGVPSRKIVVFPNVYGFADANALDKHPKIGPVEEEVGVPGDAIWLADEQGT